MKTTAAFFIVLFLVFTSLSPGCVARVCREKAVYETELAFFERAAMQSVTQLESFVKKECRCVDGQFTTKTCEDAAKTIAVVKARLPWHKAMMLHNAGIGERPADNPPPIPSAETFCPEDGQ